VAGNGVAVGVLRGAGKLSAWFDRLLTGLMDEEGRRRVLVIAALRAAMQRLDEAGADETKAFAGTAESLFWVVAADEAVRLGSGRDREWRQEQARLALLQALRYPRNVAAHESTAWQNHYGGGYTQRYWSHYGAWTWSHLPGPSAAAPLNRQNQFRSYNERLLGRAVLDTLADARDELASHWGLTVN
jgi:hypothetical protein